MVKHEKKIQAVGLGRFIGNSAAIQNVYSKIRKLAASEEPIFIEGESGTGKEICARTLHSHSSRCDHPFIALNCAALPETLVESTLFGHVKGAFTGATYTRIGAIGNAEKGTLFLDEIAELSFELQAKLLRFCEDFHYSKLGDDTSLKADIRLICATNKNIKQQVEKGLFREDLYYRLYVASITMPPLRDRGLDILDIAHYYLKYYAKKQSKIFQGFSENAEKILLNYNWPGNIRELQNIIRQIVILENSVMVLASMLPSALTKPPTKNSNNIKFSQNTYMPLWHIEKQAIENTIAFTKGDITKAAAILDIAPSTIYRKIKSWKKF